MKILLNRRGYLDERSMLIGVILFTLLSFVFGIKTAAIIIISIISLSIIVIVISVIYALYWSNKINKRSFLKYYNNKKYIVIEEELEIELDAEELKKYVTDAPIEKVSAYKYMHHYKYKKNVIKGFSFLYSQPIDNKENSTSNCSKTFIVLDRSKYPQG